MASGLFGAFEGVVGAIAVQTGDLRVEVIERCTAPAPALTIGARRENSFLCDEHERSEGYFTDGCAEPCYREAEYREILGGKGGR